MSLQKFAENAVKFVKFHMLADNPSQAAEQLHQKLVSLQQEGDHLILVGKEDFSDLAHHLLEEITPYAEEGTLEIKHLISALEDFARNTERVDPTAPSPEEAKADLDHNLPGSTK